MGRLPSLNTLQPPSGPSGIAWNAGSVGPERRAVVCHGSKVGTGMARCGVRLSVRTISFFLVFALQLHSSFILIVLRFHPKGKDAKTSRPISAYLVQAIDGGKTEVFRS